MQKEELLEILQDWNFWEKELAAGRQRSGYVNACMRFLNTNVITALTGVRRSGKSYIMRQVIKKLIESGVEKKNILMVNLEDKRFTEFYLKLLDEVYDAYVEFLSPGERPFIFLDEIHNVPKWERWVRTMHELGKARIVVSGSSSKLLGGELATVLTGRHLDISVFPLSFGEFLYFNKLEASDRLGVLAKRAEVRRLFREYAEFGGFPEVVLSSEKKHLLLAYFDDMLTKDIEKRYTLKKHEKLRTLARFYLTNTSCPITFNSLGKSLGTTTNTIEKFSSYLEEANIVFFVKRFSFKLKEQENAARKAYAIDTGLANAVGFRFSSDFGKIAETLVAIELKREAALNQNMDFYYWKNPLHEVDFVVREGRKIKQLIQVCWNLGAYRTKEREINALMKASKELTCNNLLVITENQEGREEIKTRGKKRTVVTIPLWKWLLRA